MRILVILLSGVFLSGALLASCRPTPLATLPEVIAEPAASGRVDEAAETIPDGVPEETAAAAAPATATASRAAGANSKALPTATATPSPTETATQIPTATPIGPCGMRMPQDLLLPVTLTYGLSREYEPQDLVPLADELSMQVTLGYPSEIRAVAFRPLVEMIEEMQAEGLRPQIISAYRSYAAQAIAWSKWNELYPERAAIISAPPGFSEHQLGTVVDFGSPELAEIVGEEDIEFHTYFYKTSEGAWLAENAHRYGFTLSFPAAASEATGFYYEPWHFRYVGTEMAALLREQGRSLTEYQLAIEPEPCIP